MFTRGHIHQLESGFAFNGEGFTGGYGFDSSTLRPDTNEWFEAAGAWEFLRPQILRDWIRRECRDGRDGRGGPGTRPWAFWAFDARERRRRIDGKPHPFDNPERLAHCQRVGAPHDKQFLEKLYYGVPGHLVIADDFEAVYESEAEFIDRKGLWIEGEIELAIPALATEIAAMKASDDPKQQALLPRAEAMLKRLTKLSATA